MVTGLREHISVTRRGGGKAVAYHHEMAVFPSALKFNTIPFGGHPAGCKAAERAADGDERPPRDIHGP